MNDGIDPISLRPSHHKEGRKLHNNKELINDTIRQNQKAVLSCPYHNTTTKEK